MLGGYCSTRSGDDRQWWIICLSSSVQERVSLAHPEHRLFQKAWQQDLRDIPSEASRTQPSMSPFFLIPTNKDNVGFPNENFQRQKKTGRRTSLDVHFPRRSQLPAPPQETLPQLLPSRWTQGTPHPAARCSTAPARSAASLPRRPTSSTDR